MGLESRSGMATFVHSVSSVVKDLNTFHVGA